MNTDQASERDPSNSQSGGVASESESRESVETAEAEFERLLEANLARLKEAATRKSRERDERRAKPIVCSPEWRAKHLGLSEHCVDLVKAAESAEMFAKKFCRDIRRRDDGTPRTWLVLVGENGVGKTHIAEKLYAYAGGIRMTAWDMGYWDHPPSRVWVDWPDLVASDVDGIWQDAVEADFLVVDEIGAEVDRYGKGVPIDRLRSLLSKRENKWTVVTTNTPADAWATRWDKRVADRLRRCSKPVDLSKVEPWSTRREKTK